jgi:Kef-type K+ transport system membrane component KefB
VRRRVGQAAAIAAGGVLVPFGLGVVLARFLYPDFAGPGTGPVTFCLFVSAALSVTAFPVLARILADRGMSRTEVGTLALGSAAVADVTAWCLLAGVVGVAQARPVGVIAVLGLTAAYVAVMVTVVRPLAVRHLGHSRRRFGPRGAVLILIALLASSLATEAIGIHALFGAFLLGVVIPCDGPAASELRRSLAILSGTLLLPAFFAVTGLRANVGQLAGADLWAVCAAATLAATAGKCGGTLAAARLTGLGWRDSAALGALMNTRGLMELIVLNVGLRMGVITGQLFAALVVMALATTAATGPSLWLLGWRRRPAEVVSER